MEQTLNLKAGDWQREPLIMTGNLEGTGLCGFPFGHVAAFTMQSPDKDSGNEDAALVFPVGQDRGVLAVADGVGGMQSGAQASRTALECLRDTIATARDEDWSVREAVLDGFDEANRAVLAIGGAATTLAAVRIQDQTIRTFHVGDSAVLVVGSHGKLKLQTIDHSPTGYAMEAGVLDESEAMVHDERHVILNAVGSKDMRVEIGSTLKLARRDTVLIASDGLFDNLPVPEIIELVRKGPLERCASNLVKVCRERMLNPDEGQPSKPDDLTVLLFRP
jgi:serine/threonine protein phosphatase PrpC